MPRALHVFMCGGVCLALFSTLSSGGGSVTGGPIIATETFEASDPETGLPPGWSVGPGAHAPFVRTSVERDTYGDDAPSLRISLDLHALNYRVGSARYRLPRLDQEYTLEVSLRLEQPDAPVKIDVVYLRDDGNWYHSDHLTSVVADPASTWRKYRFPLQPNLGPQSGRCWILFGLPYSKVLRSGRFWIDDLVIREGNQVAALDAYIPATSVVSGNPLELHISSGAGAVRVEFIHEGSRPVLTREPLELTGLVELETPERAWQDGCDWPIAWSAAVDDTWAPGLYTVRVSDGDRIVWDTVAIRSPQSRALVAVVIPTHTEQAYNSWGGRSFYSATTTAEVSFDRPETVGHLGPYSAVIHLVRWLSREGYDFDVLTDDDLHEWPERLSSYRALLLAGHSEYWTDQMRHNLERYFEEGGNILSLSGNTCWWQTRLVEADDRVEPGASRRLVCYKYEARNADPYMQIDPSRVTTRWDEPPVDRPPTGFLGFSWRHGGLVNWQTSSSCPCTYDWLDGYGGYTVAGASHWVFSGTGLQDGSTLGQAQAIVGYEVDGLPVTFDANGVPQPSGGVSVPDGLRILGHSPAWNEFDAEGRGTALMGIIERSDNFLFNGGTTGWSWGLAGDPIVQRVTANLLERAIRTPDSESARGTGLSAFPNPARTSVTFRTVDPPCSERVAIFDVSGRLMARPRLEVVEGSGEAVWDLRDTKGSPVAAGTYHARAGKSVISIVHLR